MTDKGKKKMTRADAKAILEADEIMKRSEESPAPGDRRRTLIAPAKAKSKSKAKAKKKFRHTGIMKEILADEDVDVEKAADEETESLESQGILPRTPRSKPSTRFVPRTPSESSDEEGMHQSSDDDPATSLADVVDRSPAPAASSAHVPDDLVDETEKEVDDAQKAFIAPTKSDARKMKSLEDVIKALEEDYPIIHLRAMAGDKNFPIKFMVELLHLSEDGRKVYTSDIGEFGKTLEEFVASGGVNADELHSAARKVLRSYQSKLASRYKAPRARTTNRKKDIRRIKKMKVKKGKKKKPSDPMKMLKRVKV